MKSVTRMSINISWGSYAAPRSPPTPPSPETTNQPSVQPLLSMRPPRACPTRRLLLSFSPARTLSRALIASCVRVSDRRERSPQDRVRATVDNVYNAVPGEPTNPTLLLLLLLLRRGVINFPVEINQEEKVRRGRADGRTIRRSAGRWECNSRPVIARQSPPRCIMPKRRVLRPLINHNRFFRSRRVNTEEDYRRPARGRSSYRRDVIISPTTLFAGEGSSGRSSTARRISGDRRAGAISAARVCPLGEIAPHASLASILKPAAIDEQV